MSSNSENTIPLHQTPIKKRSERKKFRKRNPLSNVANTASPTTFPATPIGKLSTPISVEKTGSRCILQSPIYKENEDISEETLCESFNRSVTLEDEECKILKKENENLKIQLERSKKQAELAQRNLENQIKEYSEKLQKITEEKNQVLDKLQHFKEKLHKYSKNQKEEFKKLENITLEKQKLEGELQILRKQLLDAKNESIQLLKEQKSSVCNHEKQIELLKESENHLQTVNSVLIAEKKALEVENSALKQKIQSFDEEHKNKIITLQESATKHQYEVNNLQNQIEHKNIRISELEKQLSEMQQQACLLIQELEQFKNTTAEKLQISEKENTKLRTKLEELQQDINRQQTLIHEKDSIIKKLQDTIIDMKGKVRIYCRVRPKTEFEQHQKETPLIYVNENELHMLITQKKAHSSSTKKIEFKFDRVFPPSSNQQNVFEELSDILETTLKGSNICVFAYGQTGSGKTFTMGIEQGLQSDYKKKGLIPRTVETLFDKFCNFKDISYTLRMSVFEIYNEQLRDLLNASINITSKTATPVKSSTPIKPSTPFKHQYENFVMKDVPNIEEFYNILQIAMKNRATGVTCLNQHSSRSHWYILI